MPRSINQHMLFLRLRAHTSHLMVALTPSMSTPRQTTPRADECCCYSLLQARVNCRTPLPQKSASCDCMSASPGMPHCLRGHELQELLARGPQATPCLQREGTYRSPATRWVSLPLVALSTLSGPTILLSTPRLVSGTHGMPDSDINEQVFDMDSAESPDIKVGIHTLPAEVCVALGPEDPWLGNLCLYGGIRQLQKMPYIFPPISSLQVGGMGL